MLVSSSVLGAALGILCYHHTELNYHTIILWKLILIYLFCRQINLGSEKTNDLLVREIAEVQEKCFPIIKSMVLGIFSVQQWIHV